MEREQLNLDLATADERAAALANYLRPVGLALRQISVLCVIAGLGELIQVGSQRGSKLTIAKSRLAKECQRFGLSVAANTWMAGAVELETAELVQIVRWTTPWTYYVNWSRIAHLTESSLTQPAPETLAIFGGDQPFSGQLRSTPVNSGQPPRVRESIQESNPCPESVSSRDTCDPDLADRLARPWDRRYGLTGNDLSSAVQSGDLTAVRRLYSEALALEWIGNSEDDRLRFLTVAHHCATVDGLGNRMSALVARMKRGCDVAGCRHGSENWAAAVLRRGAAVS